jgi:hypothetical protein
MRFFEDNTKNAFIPRKLDETTDGIPSESASKSFPMNGHVHRF